MAKFRKHLLQLSRAILLLVVVGTLALTAAILITKPRLNARNIGPLLDAYLHRTYRHLSPPCVISSLNPATFPPIPAKFTLEVTGTTINVPAETRLLSIGLWPDVYQEDCEAFLLQDGVWQKIPPQIGDPPSPYDPPAAPDLTRLRVAMLDNKWWILPSGTKAVRIVPKSGAHLLCAFMKTDHSTTCWYDGAGGFIRCAMTDDCIPQIAQGMPGYRLDEIGAVRDHLRALTDQRLLERAMHRDFGDAIHETDRESALETALLTRNYERSDTGPYTEILQWKSGTITTYLLRAGSFFQTLSFSADGTEKDNRMLAADKSTTTLAAAAILQSLQKP